MDSTGQRSVDQTYRLGSGDLEGGEANLGDPAAARPPVVWRWLPFAFAATVVTCILLAAQTPVRELARFAAYAGFAVVLPGTLLYRALRRRPHTFVEDVAMGAAVGLTLELAAWAVFSALDLRAWVGLWPLAVIGTFTVIPRLRRHWRAHGYGPTPLGWSWSVAGVVPIFTAYLSAVFFGRNPILPTDESTLQYPDLTYHLSLAGEMTHRFPPNLPQVVGEPLHYHWFAHVHMAMAAMIGHIDLPVVALRLAVPGLCIAAIVLSAVVGWRLSGRPAVGAVTAVLFWAIGEVHFTHPVQFPFGTQATFVIWHGISMIHSWVLLLALIAVLADVLGRIGGDTLVPEPGGAVPAIGPGAYVLVALLALGSSGSKASSLPVTLGALGFTAAILLATRWRLPAPVIAIGAMVAAAQVFAAAVLFDWQTYGLKVGALAGLAPYWAHSSQPRPEWHQWLIVLAVWVAFLINMQLRLVGIVPFVWLRRGRLRPVECFLLGGALAGPVLYFSFTTVNAQYFTRAGFTFGVILSAWGYVLVYDRARLSRRATIWLGVGATAFAVALVAAELLFAGPAPSHTSALWPLLQWSGVLAGIGALTSLAWWASRRRWPRLRGCGALVALTAVLVVGAPGLVMDAYQSLQKQFYRGSGPLPRSRVEAARWVRNHSEPDDVLATNVHCLTVTSATCNARSFWLSAYAERSVLVEGWRFAPRIVEVGTVPFWDSARLRLNDEAFTAPTVANLDELRRRYGVRWLIVDREVGRESGSLADLATLRFDNGRMGVYELRGLP